MIHFSEWAETYSVAGARGQLATDRSDMGAVGWEGFQQIVDAMKLSMQNPETHRQAKTIVKAFANKLSYMIASVDPNLAKKMSSGVSNFSASTAASPARTTETGAFSQEKQI